MRSSLGMLASAGALLLAACQPAPTPMARAAPGEQIAWREGNVDDAFAEAKAQHKPVLLYWGAKWCPPCNAMKQTIFKDPVFIAETRDFIPVHLDGDAKDAQVWSGRFNVSGYPTVLILQADHTEVTRLSGASSATQLADTLKLAAKSRLSEDELFRRAADPGRLSRDEWKILSSYDIYNDTSRLGDGAKRAQFVWRLAAAAPDPQDKRRFTLDALLAGNDADKLVLTPAQQAQAAAVLSTVLSRPQEAAADRTEMVSGAADIIQALPPGPQRQTLQSQLVAELDRLGEDAATPLALRLYAVQPEVTFAKVANGGVAPPAVLRRLHDRVMLVDREARDPSLRQALMPGAGQLLADAGDTAGAERLWKSELPHAVAPYYYMSDLGQLEMTMKHPAAAVAWMRKAADSAEGPATRLQWAMEYSEAVMSQTPQDAATVLSSADMVIERVRSSTAGLDGRTHKKIVAWREALHAWGAGHGRAIETDKLEARLTSACGRVSCIASSSRA